MANPVLHGPLGNPISPERMHKEIHAERHAHCTPPCDMLASCRNILTTLGHDPDADAPAACPACRERARSAEQNMTSELPQRIPGARAAPVALGDPCWYAAVVRALRDTPAALFPCLTDAAARARWGGVMRMETAMPTWTHQRITGAECGS